MATLTHSSNKSRERTVGDEERRWEVQSRRPSSACCQKRRVLLLMAIRERLEKAARGETGQRRHYRADLTGVHKNLSLSKGSVGFSDLCLEKRERFRLRREMLLEKTEAGREKIRHDQLEEV